MAGPWKTRLAFARRAIDAEFGETFRVEPMRKSQYQGAVADPDRAPFTLEIAHLRNHGGEDDLGGAGSKSWSVLIAGGAAELHVDPDSYPLARTILKGDQIVALDRNSEPRFEVARLDRDQRNRLVFQLAFKS
ncbi:hypothetical protein [Breoghania sp. L-A4]|uniref:hypothetical protein n=1 Tax=Breoghania sp. L-A4 TaxID=2304600 RepID=UPI000E35D289|nr:hypothetical protein [Breoghania sp. L-A4]AXS39263.1 hypothetical protein D1F64_03355 [Breoghania sp. L-A4]